MPPSGMATPVAAFETQVSVAGLHHCSAPQLVSLTQALAHAPLDWQTLPAWIAPAALQSVVIPAAPQVVQAAALPGQ